MGPDIDALKRELERQNAELEITFEHFGSQSGAVEVDPAVLRAIDEACTPNAEPQRGSIRFGTRC